MRRGTFLPAVKLVVALPDGLSVLAVGVPHLGAVPAPAVRALYPAGKYARAACPVLPGMSGHHLVLCFLEHGRADDGLVVVLHIILRHFALIHFLLFGEEVHRVHFLQERVPFVLFVCEDAFDRAGRPFLFPAGRGDALRSQQLRNRMGRAPLQEKAVNPADSFRLFLIDDEVPILAPVIAKEPLERHRDLAVRKTLAIGCILPTTGQIRDFHPLERAPAGRTSKKEPSSSPFPFFHYFILFLSFFCILSRKTAVLSRKLCIQTRKPLYYHENS